MKSLDYYLCDSILQNGFETESYKLVHPTKLAPYNRPIINQGGSSLYTRNHTLSVVKSLSGLSTQIPKILGDLVSWNSARPRERQSD